MKKTLLNILLAGSLAFGTANAQDSVKTKYEKFDRDHSGFPEEIMGAREEFGKEFWHIVWGKLQAYNNTIVYYFDTNNDEFYDFIRIFNRENYSNVRIRDFYIDKNTGLINYEMKGYSCSVRKWDKAFTDKNFYEIVKKDYDAILPLYGRLYHSNLTKQDLDDLAPGFGMRVGNLINAYKSEEKLKDILEIFSE